MGVEGKGKPQRELVTSFRGGTHNGHLKGDFIA